MNTRKRMLALLLGAALLVSCLTGCGKKEEPVSDVETDGVPTISIGVKQSANVEDYDTNEFTLWLEEQLGINLEFVYFSSNGSEATQQLSLMMSGGETLPDILWYFNLGDTAVLEYGEDGYLVDLAPYFGQYSQHFDEAISKISVEDDKEKVLQLGTDPDSGAMYGFPCYQHSSGPDNATNHILINTKWLEAVGEDMPSTPEELHTVLKKFAAMDPNGNGMADEMPMVGSTKIARGDTLEWVINAYIHCNDQYFWNAENGKISVPYTTDEYREALIFLNQLYKEDLISPTVFSISKNDEMKEILTPSTGPAIAGITAGHISLIHNADNETLFEYAYAPALDAGTGKGGYRLQSGSTFRYSSYITTDCEDPVTAFKLLDFLCSEEAFLFMRYGVEGRDWEYAEEGMLDMFGNQATINLIDSAIFSSQNNVCWHALDSTVADYSSYTMYSPDLNSGSFTDRFNAWKDDFTAALFQDEIKDELVFDIVYPGSYSEELADLSSPIVSYIAEARAIFVSGTMDPSNDQHWNEYLNNLETLGLSRYIEITQECYDNM